jgi:predicted naringenin-chalcone synthase
MLDFSRLFSGKLGWDLEDFQVRKVQRISSVEKISGHVDKDIYFWEPKSLRIRSINFWHVFLAEYLNYAYLLSIAGSISFVISQIWFGSVDSARLKDLASDPLVWEAIGIAAIFLAYISHWKVPVYCMENVVFVPPEDWKVSRKDIITMMTAQKCFSETSMDFQTRLLDNSGTGEATHWPPGILMSKDGETKSECNLAAARCEAKEVLFTLVRDILKRTGVQPNAIDFLIINCSLFCPTPSLCALVCNEFCLRQDVRTYNLGGMGCSANVIAVDLAKQLLQNQPGSRALVLSTENITQNLYQGNEKSMLLQNTLFRCGGSALLLSSRRVDSLRAKYRLLYTFRTQVSDDNSFQCVYQKEDAEGNSGVALSKDIVTVAGRAMRQNFVQLGPYVLPLREQAKVLFNQFWIRFLAVAKRRQWAFFSNIEAPKGYTPNFSKGIDHFCIHAGGRAVIEGVQKNLNLTDRQIQPSVQTLYNWGNTSSSSIWYETDWVERYGDIHPGERVLQIAFGSGFKCNSAVWVALHVDGSKVRQPWMQFAYNADGSPRCQTNGHVSHVNGIDKKDR